MKPIRHSQKTGPSPEKESLCGAGLGKGKTVTAEGPETLSSQPSLPLLEQKPSSAGDGTKSRFPYSTDKTEGRKQKNKNQNPPP